MAMVGSISLEFSHELHGGIHIQEVVVAQGLAIVLRKQPRHVPEKSALLVGVFTIAQGRLRGLQQ